MSHAPVVTAWALSACMALALAGTVYRMPIQVDEALTVTLQCLAADVGAPSIRRQLAEMTREVDCAGVTLPWRLN